MKRCGLALWALALSASGFAQIEVEEILPPPGFNLVAIESISQDGNVIYYEAHSSTTLQSKPMLWRRGVGSQEFPSSPSGLTRVADISGNGLVYFMAGGGTEYWNTSTNATEAINGIRLEDVTYDGDQALLSHSVTNPITGVTDSAIIRWKPFDSAGTEVSFPGKVLGRVLGNHMLNNYFAEVGLFIDRRHLDHGRYETAFLSKIYYRNTAVYPVLTQILSGYGRILGVARNSPTVLYMKMDSEGFDTEIALQKMGSSPVTMPSSMAMYGIHDFDLPVRNLITENGKMFVGKTRFYREDLGVETWYNYFLQFFSQQEYISRFSDARFISISANAKTLVANGGSFDPDSFNEHRHLAKKLIVFHNPDTFRKKIGERYAITARIRARSSFLYALDPDDKTRDTLECFYNLSSPLFSPSNQVRSSVNAVSLDAGESVSLGGNSSFTWNVGASQTFPITGTISDLDIGGTNDTILSGPLSLSLTDLKNGGRTFSDGEVSLIVTATYLGPVLDMNS